MVLRGPPFCMRQQRCIRLYSMLPLHMHHGKLRSDNPDMLRTLDLELRAMSRKVVEQGAALFVLSSMPTKLQFVWHVALLCPSTMKIKHAMGQNTHCFQICNTCFKFGKRTINDHHCESLNNWCRQPGLPILNWWLSSTTFQPQPCSKFEAWQHKSS